MVNKMQDALKGRTIKRTSYENEEAFIAGQNGNT